MFKIDSFPTFTSSFHHPPQKMSHISLNIPKEDLVCLVCFDELTGHLYQCVNGPHYLCKKCQKNIQVCPICITPVLRNTYMENQILSHISTCPNPGCEERLLKNDHDCEFAPLPEVECPKCKQQQKSLVQHLKKEEQFIEKTLRKDPISGKTTSFFHKRNSYYQLGNFVLIAWIENDNTHLAMRGLTRAKSIKLPLKWVEKQIVVQSEAPSRIVDQDEGIIEFDISNLPIRSLIVDTSKYKVEVIQTEEDKTTASLHISYETEFNEYPTKETVVRGLVQIELKSTSQRLPVDIVLLLDKSGSMRGAKLQEVKRSVEWMLTALEDTDRLSVIAFSDNVEVLVPLAKITPSNKALIQSKLHHLQAGSGTNMWDALGFGISPLAQRKYPNRPSALFLLTDGQTQAGKTYNRENVIQLGSAIPNFALSTFGYGGSHDAKLLADLAEKLGGTFHYIHDVEKTSDDFGRALARAFSQRMHNVKVRLSPVDGVSTNLSGVENIHVLYAEQPRSFPFSLNVTAGLEETIGRIVVDSDKDETKSVDIIVKRCSSPHQIQSPRVANEFLRTDTAEAMKQAEVLASKGKIREAKALLQSTLEKLRKAQGPFAEGLRKDVENLLLGYATPAKYQEYGRVQTVGHVSSLVHQYSVSSSRSSVAFTSPGERKILGDKPAPKSREWWKWW